MKITIPANALDFHEPFKLELTGDELVDQLNLYDAIGEYRTKFETNLFNKITQQIRTLKNA